MKANHNLLMQLAELGILRSIPDFLAEPLKPGRLRARFMEIEFIVDSKLKQVNKSYPDIFIDNVKEITAYLDKFGKILNPENIDKEDLHVASVVCFCMSFLENTKSVYSPKLYKYLQDIIDYYERANNIKYSDFMEGRKFHEEWEAVNNE